MFVRLDDVAASRERLKNLATIAAKRQRVSIRSHDRVSNRVLPDATTMRQPDCVFQSKSFFHADLIKKGRVAKCERPKHLIKKGIMDTQQNPNEPGKSPSPGQQGGQQQDRDREERERQERERQQREGEKQGGGQQGGGQQSGR